MESPTSNDTPPHNPSTTDASKCPYAMNNIFQEYRELSIPSLSCIDNDSIDKCVTKTKKSSMSTDSFSIESKQLNKKVSPQTPLEIDHSNAIPVNDAFRTLEKAVSTHQSWKASIIWHKRRNDVYSEGEHTDLVDMLNPLTLVQQLLLQEKGYPPNTSFCFEGYELNDIDVLCKDIKVQAAISSGTKLVIKKNKDYKGNQ